MNEKKFSFISIDIGFEVSDSWKMLETSLSVLLPHYFPSSKINNKRMKKNQKHFPHGITRRKYGEKYSICEENCKQYANELRKTRQYWGTKIETFEVKIQWRSNEKKVKFRDCGFFHTVKRSTRINVFSFFETWTFDNQLCELYFSSF